MPLRAHCAQTNTARAGAFLTSDVEWAAIASTFNVKVHVLPPTMRTRTILPLSGINAASKCIAVLHLVFEGHYQSVVRPGVVPSEPVAYPFSSTRSAADSAFALVLCEAASFSVRNRGSGTSTGSSNSGDEDIL